MPKNNPTAALNANAVTTDFVVLTVCHPAKCAANMAAAVSERQAQRAADQAKRHRFHQELQQNIAAGRAKCLADPDLAGPLRHRYEHDVHDADTADKQAHAGDADQKPGGCADRIAVSNRLRLPLIRSVG